MVGIALPWVVQAGSECVIRSLGGNGKLARRLADMGVLPGERLRIVRLAPLGGTVEVSLERGQSLALREEEIAALDCTAVAVPLSPNAVQAGHTYRVRSLLGGRTFRQRMADRGIRSGTLIRIRNPGVRPLPVVLLPGNGVVTLGKGEADKIIIESAHDGIDH